ncbi:Zyg-11 member B, cell cycle regulator [Blomia tropicalis]|nr:Zyg-11 member B, cell cycle regulator [Blomia tropicalis]
MAESPKTLYEISLEQVAYRLNCLVHYYKDALLHKTKSLEMSILNPYYNNGILENGTSQDHDDLMESDDSDECTGARFLRRTQSIDDSSKDRRDSTITKHHLSSPPLPTSSQKPKIPLGSTRASNFLVNSSHCDDRLKRMKRGYHSFVNTFIFGGARRFNERTTPMDIDEQTMFIRSYRVPTLLVENILETFQQKFPLTDRVLKLAIFNGGINRLTKIKIEDASNLSTVATKITQLSPLRKMAHKLVSLSAHNVAESCNDESILVYMKHLKTLDISDSRGNPDHDDRLGTFIHEFAKFKHLVELDISGRASVTYQDIRKLVIAKKSNPNTESLQFLGLLESMVNYDEIFDILKISGDELMMTGTGNTRQIIECLKRYQDNVNFVAKALISLYVSRGQFEPEEILTYREEILNYIILLLHRYISSVNVVLVGTACLYIFTHLSSIELIPSTLLAKEVEINIMVLEKYPTNQAIVKNILFCLCIDRILQDVSFDRMRCLQNVMDTLVTFQDVTICRLALAICSILAAKVPTEQTQTIGANQKYMKRLIEFVDRRKIFSNGRASPEYDNQILLFKLALSALWNFTDESPKTCEIFIQHKGLKLYINALEEFKDDTMIEVKILGLINNIAEVATLRENLVNANLLLHLKRLIDSKHIDISYFSSGILAQLCSDRNLDWPELDGFNLKKVMKTMKRVVLSWKTPSFEMVAYRSFVPFLQLLECYDHEGIQLWALWAIRHVTSKSGTRKYCEMLHEERCLGLIIDIIDEKLKSYHFHDRRHRQFMRARLMEVVSDNCYDNSRCFKCESKEPNIANVLRNEAADDLSNDDQQFLKECNTTSKMKQSTDDKQFLKECNTTSIMKQSTDESIDSIYRCMENSFNIDGKIEVSRSCPKPNFDHLIISKEDLKLFRQLNDKNRISLISCDCSLRVYLCEDPFLCLPSLILKTFQRHCPRLLPTELSF